MSTDDIGGWAVVPPEPLVHDRLPLAFNPHPHRTPAFAITETADADEPQWGGDLQLKLHGQLALQRDRILTWAWVLQRPDMRDRLFVIESHVDLHLDVNPELLRRNRRRATLTQDVMVASSLHSRGDR